MMLEQTDGLIAAVIADVAASAFAMNNQFSRRWEKATQRSGNPFDVYPLRKAQDFDVFERDAIRANYKCYQAEDLYTSGFADQEDGSTLKAEQTMAGKAQGNFMLAAHNAMALRYSTRIKSISATMSRRASMVYFDLMLQRPDLDMSTTVEPAGDEAISFE